MMSGCFKDLTIYVYALILIPVQRLSKKQKLEVRKFCAHAHLKRTVRKITLQYDQVLAHTGLHITQFTLLVTASLMGEVAVNDLAAQLALDQTTLSRNLQVLQRHGLVEMVPSPLDARVRLVRITPEGEAALARAYPAWRKAQEEVSAAFSPQEYQQFLGFLSRLEASS
ncbi:MAG: hypothetical protein KatS3mg071_0743 [Meiothermus sp.]|nr:MAG: hypothetical protein KatS3mg071_0743 [Meiothermus sp.]